MNAGSFAPLIDAFARNWAEHRRTLEVTLSGTELEVDQNHPLHDELEELCKGQAASLPYFSRNTDDVFWCSVAPDKVSLRNTVTALQAWVLPGLGGTKEDDGPIRPDAARGGIAAKIIGASPDGYYRWRCPKRHFNQVLEKLRARRALEKVRPQRARPPRPSLYELRARFASALLIGDRDGAEQIIGLLDLFQLETAVNTQFMRIRLWHHFGELDCIRDHPELPHLLAQPLPSRVREWISDALDLPAAPPSSPAPIPHPPLPPAEATAANPEPFVAESPVATWLDWFDALGKSDRTAAAAFLEEQTDGTASNPSAGFISSLVDCLDDLVIDDTLRARERGLIVQGVGALLEAYVRESGFPRAALGDFYLSLVRLWCALHAGNSAGQEHGHVLLELANALLQLNQSPGEVRQMLEAWWKAKPTPSQLYFALDAIELLERELPDVEASALLWVEAASVIKRAPDTLATADLALWRRVGARLGFDEDSISQYLPPESIDEEIEDLLAASDLQHVAIVCLRERQAKDAADEIRNRSGAKVTVVTATDANHETTLALSSDVVLFVWMASTHAVFRAFDGYDRKRLVYVQGTGATSIVRSLERWILSS